MSKPIKIDKNKIPAGCFYRTCQECGNKQIDSPPDPKKEPPISYRYRKCKKCKSESLDYGTTMSDPDPEDWFPE